MRKVSFFFDGEAQVSMGVRVFSNEIGLGGNLAAVIKGLDEKYRHLKAEIAMRLPKYPATVFISNSRQVGCSAELEFYTPAGKELAICGHGALASSLALFPVSEESGSTEKIKVSTKNGLLTIKKNENGLFQLEMEKAKVIKFDFSPDEVIKLIGLNDPYSIDQRLPFHVTSAGISILLVPLSSRANLFSLSPNVREIKKWTEEKNLAGIYVYTPDVFNSRFTFHARCFNPRFNPLGEDVATGVAAMSLASVYAKKDEQIIIEQGYILNSPSNIFVTKSLADLIYMGGRVSLSSEKIDLNKLLAEVNNDPNSSPQRLLQS